MDRTNHKLEERFWKKVDKCKPDDCWNWVGAKLYSGYGRIGIYKGKGDYTVKSAHRISYELHFGEITDGMDVCHKCDNPSCVNPNHLFLGTKSDNANDRNSKGRFDYKNRKINVLKGENHPFAILDEKSVKEIVRLHHSGMKQKDIAEKLELKKQRISRILTGRDWSHITGIERKKGRAIGSSNGMAKLNEHQVREIKDLLSKKVKQNKIAEMYNVTPMVITKIKQGKLWNHI